MVEGIVNRFLKFTGASLGGSGGLIKHLYYVYVLAPYRLRLTGLVKSIQFNSIIDIYIRYKN